MVELEAKLRPAGRRRVERGAAVQRCYKQAIAHGFGRQGSGHDEKCRIDRSFRFWRHVRLSWNRLPGKFGQGFPLAREFWDPRSQLELIELSIFAGSTAFPELQKHKNDLIPCLS